MSNYQGKLDGLCGPYAIVNAFQRCGVSDADRVFQEACAAMAPRRWPEAIWEGTTLKDLMRMIKRCRNEIDDADCINVSYPFLRETPKNNKEYWKKFDAIFDQKAKIKCAILGLTHPWPHWIVAIRETPSQIVFLDADPRKPNFRKNRSSLHAGSKNSNHNKWIITKSELIIFETNTK